MDRLMSHLETARAGQRQIVFVIGDAGLGKTTLVRSFLELAGAHAPARLAHGQCFQQHGSVEAYMPVLEALGRLCREPGGSQVVEVLFRQAPTWLAQMPSLVDPGEADELRKRSMGSTRDRMLREMVEALEALTAETPLVLALEDLHWSDPSTVDLLGWVARRQDPARHLATAILGEPEPGILLLEEGLLGLDELGAGTDRPYCLSMLAEAEGMRGRHGRALEVIEEAMSRTGETGRYFYAAEPHRLRGQLLTETSPDAHAEAEAAYHRGRGEPRPLDGLSSSHGKRGGADSVGIVVQAERAEPCASGRIPHAGHLGAKPAGAAGQDRRGQRAGARAPG